MVLNKIQIHNFRNHKNSYIEFNVCINIFYGENGSGKTNLLESIYFLLTSKSHKFISDDNLIMIDEKDSLIKGDLIVNNNKKRLSIAISNKKELNVDGKIISNIKNYIKDNKVVIFYPDELDLVKGSPLVRRRYMNRLISTIDINYLDVFEKFNKILKTKNAYLKKVRETSEFDLDYLSILNQEYVFYSHEIYKYRNNIIKRISEKVLKIYKEFYPTVSLSIKYKTNLVKEEIEFDKEILMDRIIARQQQEVLLGRSLIGPQFDDIIFCFNSILINDIASQGQQRTLVLCLKLVEIELIKELTGVNPILLLDDVFSELDEKRVNLLLEYVISDLQCFITTTDIKTIDEKLLKKSKLLNIKDGKIEEVLCG